VDDPYSIFTSERLEATTQTIIDWIQTPLEVPKPRALDIEAPVSSLKMGSKNTKVATARNGAT
jgi:hypothetical protein